MGSNIKQHELTFRPLSLPHIDAIGVLVDTFVGSYDEKVESVFVRRHYTAFEPFELR